MFLESFLCVYAEINVAKCRMVINNILTCIYVYPRNLTCACRYAIRYADSICLAKRLSPYEMESVARVQILYEADCVSLRTNTLWKRHETISFSPLRSMNK